MKTDMAIFAAGCFWGVQYYFDQVPGVVETTAGYIGGHTQNPSYEQVCTHTTGHAEAVKIEFDPAMVIADVGNSNADEMQGAGEQRTEPYSIYSEEAAQPATQQRVASKDREGGSVDQSELAFRILLKQFFRMHDPTQLNRQGPDVGDNYRSAIFYQNEQQKAAAQKIIEELNKTKFSGKIVTSLEPGSPKAVSGVSAVLNRAEDKNSAIFWPAEEYHQKYTLKTGMGACHIPYAPA